MEGSNVSELKLIPKEGAMVTLEKKVCVKYSAGGDSPDASARTCRHCLRFQYWDAINFSFPQNIFEAWLRFKGQSSGLKTFVVWILPRQRGIAF